MTLSDIGRDDVLQAVAEFDRLGRTDFLDKYGFRPARSYFLEIDEHRYDSKAITGAAHGFIEAHHTKAVYALNAGSKTKLGDLALLCSNCHRMIHSARPWLSIEELKTAIRAAGNITHEGYEEDTRDLAG